MANFWSHSERGPQINWDTAGMAVPVEQIQTFLDTSPLHVWKTQPSVRKVVDFIASNIASIPLHVYRREDDGRFRERDTTLARLIDAPSRRREETAYLFWKRVLIDWLVYDRAAVDVDPVSGELLRVPPEMWVPRVDQLGGIQSVVVQGPEGRPVDRSPDEFLLWAGYSGPGRVGTSPMETLRSVLDETSDALAFRAQMWKRQATHTGVVEREETWDSAESRQNFLEGLRAFDASSERAGGTMLLDEGMKWKDKKPSFTPADLDDIEARKLTDIEVCSMFHVAPEMLGIRQGNYANMEAFRQSLYRDNLGPYIDGWEQAVAPLVPMLGEDPATVYVEAFLDAKLRGSFEDQAKVFQTSVGAPVMSRNEARAKMNLPNVEGGDELVTPLNVLIGDQASPTDSGTQNEKAAPRVGRELRVKSADHVGDWAPSVQSELERFFARQADVLSRRMKAKDADWWDGDRWDRELADTLTHVAKRISGDVGPAMAAGLGFDPDLYSAPRTYAYLEKVAQSRAGWINAKTIAALEEAVEWDLEPETVFEEIHKHRTRIIAAAFAAAVVGWVAEETARQLMPGHGWKRWIVTSSNPRPSHAAMDGETVPVGDSFSNGGQWPGDPVSGVDEVAGCMCGVEVTRTIQPYVGVGG